MGLTAAQRARFPHLATLAAFRLPPEAVAAAAHSLKGQLAVGATRAGQGVDATSLQIPGVLDDLYSAKAGPVTLGPSFHQGEATLRLWAPTARDMKLRVFDDSAPATAYTTHPMTLDPASGIWSFVSSRLLTFGMVLGLAFLVTVSLLLSTALSALGKWWAPFFGRWELVAQVLDIAVNFGVLTVVFGAIYKLMPRAHIQWRDVWVGAFVTALLFVIGKFLIGLYLGKGDVGASFGAFGSMVIVMVWIYYSAQIFLLGAEFTKVYASRHGSKQGEAWEYLDPDQNRALTQAAV
jgi:hypothetical protein